MEELNKMKQLADEFFKKAEEFIEKQKEEEYIEMQSEVGRRKEENN